MSTYAKFTVMASVCRESFFDFTKEFWDVTVPEAPVWNWHIEVLCNEAQAVMERVFKGKEKEHDLLINIPTGLSKSTIFSQMLPAWTYTRMVTMRHICGSHTEDLVLHQSVKCRDIVKSEKYQKCFPEVMIREGQDAKGYWENTKGGFRFACTVGGKSPVGFHAHCLTVDDPLDPEKANSPKAIRTANRWLEETLPSRAIDINVTPIILVMQRLDVDDPSAFMLKRGGVRHVCLPAELTKDVQPIELRSKYNRNGLLDPVRRSRKALDRLKLNGLRSYSGQQLQNPIPKGGIKFQREWLENKAVKEAPAVLRKCRYIDKAGSEDAGANTCAVLLGFDDNTGNCYIIDRVKGQWSSHKRNQVILETAKRDGVEVEIGIETEPGSGGKESSEISIKELAGFNVHPDRPVGNKEARADPFMAYCEAGKVFIVEGHWNKDYVDNLCVFPAARFKDDMDATSGAFNRLTLNNINWNFADSSETHESMVERMPKEVSAMFEDGIDDEDIHPDFEHFAM